jgi:hypothetical protein
MALAEALEGSLNLCLDFLLMPDVQLIPELRDKLMACTVALACLTGPDPKIEELSRAVSNRISIALSRGDEDFRSNVRNIARLMLELRSCLLKSEQNAAV